MSTTTDQYLVDYEEIMDRMIELADTVFPAVEAEVLNTPRLASEQKDFTTSHQLEHSTPVGTVVVLSDNSYQKTARNRWQCLRPGQRDLHLMTLDLVAVLLRSGRRGIVIVLPATTE